MNMEAGLHDHQAGLVTKSARGGAWKGKMSSKVKNTRKARDYLRSGFYSFCSGVGLCKNKYMKKK